MTHSPTVIRALLDEHGLDPSRALGQNFVADANTVRKIVRLAVEAGQEVAAGQPVLVMEAMKMENEIRAPRDGRVHEIAVGAGQAVETGAVLFTLE